MSLADQQEHQERGIVVSAVQAVSGKQLESVCDLIFGWKALLSLGADLTLTKESWFFFCGAAVALQVS